MVGLRGQDLVGGNPLAARRIQGVDLKVESLLVGGDPGIADQHALAALTYRETDYSRTSVGFCPTYYFFPFRGVTPREGKPIASARSPHQSCRGAAGIMNSRSGSPGQGGEHVHR
jgi:hypothetical protein